MCTFERNRIPEDARIILDEINKNGLTKDEYSQKMDLEYQARLVTKFSELDSRVDQLISITAGRPDLLALLAQLKLGTQRLVFNVNPAKVGE